MTNDPLRNLYGDDVPSPELRARVERTLESSGAFASRRIGFGGWRLAAAAVLVLAAIGAAYQAGRSRPKPVSLAGSYVLLLYEDSTYHDPRPVREIVAEYAAWGDSLATTGALVLAEKLGETRHDVVGAGAAPGAGPAPTGMFIVRAPDAAVATAIARSSPHVRVGGRIVVQPIDVGPAR